MKKIFTCLFVLAQSIYGFAQTTSTFEDLTLDASGYWDGSDASGGFADGNAYFENVNDGYWSDGFAYSNIKNNTTAGYENMYAAYPKSGVGKSNNYAIGSGSALIKLSGTAKGKSVTGFYVANTTYAYLSMLNGDNFSTKFGGANGNTPDWFLLTITGFHGGNKIKDTVKVYLADYRSADNTKDYILDTWRWIDTRPLGNVDSLIFELTASNGSGYDMTTPDYFAMDHFNEPLYDSSVAKGSVQAIFKTDASIKSWASACTVTRGLQDIAVPAGAVASAGKDVNATGSADGTIVSLGDNGVALLEFATPIKNGIGADFAVFENSLDGRFLELAFVEVSSDGVHYVRFPSISKTNAYTQLNNAAQMDAALLYNLAGKYISNYGTPFDLEELKNNSLVDIDNITHMKIIDVIGSIDLLTSSKDSLGNPVNDPYPTAFASGGFDLDAVGVINENNLATSVTKSSTPLFNIYPNPSSNQFNISLTNTSYIGEQLNVFDASGTLISTQEIAETNSVDASGWLNGIYYIRVGNTAQKIVKID